MVSWRLYEEERADIHEFLASLTPDQWDTPSLCEGWRVRNVAVHLQVDGPEQDLGRTRPCLKGAQLRFAIHRINDWWVDRNRNRPTQTIVDAFAGPWSPGLVSRRLGPEVGIRATVIHHQDMRRPLGMARIIPEERLKAALDFVLTPAGSPNLGSFERGEGLRLRATDLDWSWGDGPEVSGPAKSILMAVAGRSVALSELSGESQSALSVRAR